MVAVQVADKNLADFVAGDIEIAHAHLRAFPAINEEKVLMYLQNLSAHKAPVRRSGSADTQYFQGKSQSCDL